MFGKSKRQIKNVTFVQPLKGEVYFFTPIAYATYMQNSKEKEGKQVFQDSDLALAGKLKLIFEREKMSWFEIREEKSTISKDEHFFALYYYPHRLVASRIPSFDESSTLQDIKKLFDFIVTEDQPRLAEVPQTRSLSAYRSIEEQLRVELETAGMSTDSLHEELEAIPLGTEELEDESEADRMEPGESREESETIPATAARRHR